MTILPKKKISQNKQDDSTDPTASTIPPSDTHTVSRVSRRASSPTPRWGHSSTRDDGHRISSHDQSTRFDQEPVANFLNVNPLRRPRSPHRSLRKQHWNTAPVPGPHYKPSSASTSAVVSNNKVVSDKGSLNDEETERGYNSEDEYYRPPPPAKNSSVTKENLLELENRFETALREKRNLYIRHMREDGACLFRAIADQVYGDQEMHSIVRKNCVDYMTKNADFYSQYVTEEFSTYLSRKRIENCHGNHLEMQAMCELFNRPIQVYQYSIDPINTFHSHYKTDNEPMRISYHGNTHYNSLYDPYKATIGVGLGLPGYQPGQADKNLLSDAMKTSENQHLEERMLEDKKRETDWELTQETIEEQVARESYLQWLADNQKRENSNSVSAASTHAASAACSSATAADSWWGGVLGSPVEHNPGCVVTATPPLPLLTSMPLSVGVRSPRNRSAQNSPKQSEVSVTEGEIVVTAVSSSDSLGSMDQSDNAIISADWESTMASSSASGSRSTATFPLTDAGSSACEEAAVSKSAFNETASLLNDFPPHMYGSECEWDENDIIAQVIAQSQQEYLDSLKKANRSCSASDDDS